MSARVGYGWLIVWVVFVALVLWSPAVHAEELARATPRAIASYALSNGLKVLLEEDHRQKLVAICVRYGTGARDDPKGKSGLAHLVEHLTYRGSRHLKDGELATLFQRAGAADLGGETGFDATSFSPPASAADSNFAVVPAERRPSGIGVVSSEPVANLVMLLPCPRRDSPDTYAADLTAILIGKLWSSGLDQFENNLPDQYAAELEAHVKATTPEDVQTFVRRYLTRQNTVVAVEGSKRLLADSLKRFGNTVWKSWSQMERGE
jgi:predicted Zn-dependent peptidase